MTLTQGSSIRVPFFINETDTLAGTSCELVAPETGYITGLFVTVQKTVTTGGAVTVQIGTTDVAGLSVTVADGAVKGTRYSDEAPTAGTATQDVTKGDRIQVTPAAAFATAGAISGHVVIKTGNRA